MATTSNTVTVTIHNVQYLVAVDPREGGFSIQIGKEYFSDLSLSKVKDWIKRTTTKKKLKGDVLVTVLIGDGAKLTRLVGLTADEKEVLTRTVDGSAADDRIDRHTTVYRMFTENEQAEYARLVKAERDAKYTLDAFKRDRLYVHGKVYASTADDVIKADLDARAKLKIAAETTDEEKIATT